MEDKRKVTRRKSVICPAKGCGAMAHTRSSVKISNELTQKYCFCTDEKCGAVFIMSQSFSHYLVEPKKKNIDEVKALAYKLSPEEFEEFKRVIVNGA